MIGTHVYSRHVTRVNDDDHVSQVTRASLAAERADLPQQDSGHNVPGEAQGSGPDGREGQGPHLKPLGLLQTVCDDGC